ncbi:MAG: adenosine deaminase [Chloroflexota bacterium]|nr:adenosine deaminase [Chloroflexota bacterium]
MGREEFRRPALMSPSRDALDQFIGAMPKVELHVHLEGTVRPATLRELARKHHIDLPVGDDASLAAFYRFRDFDHFIDVYVAACECLRQPEDFTRVVCELGADAASQHIHYLEVHFNPEPHARKRGITFTELLAGMNEGRRAVRDTWGVDMRWIADGVRDADSGPISVEQTVDWITRLDPSDGVVALGLGGKEIGYPPELFAAPFRRAREAGLNVVAHAGETSGPASIWSTLRHLSPARIGHEIGAVHDPSLVDHLAETRIPLEVCPTSNLRTGVVRDLAEHPFRRLDDAGVLLTVNSDDPPMFGTTLTDEFRLLSRRAGYGVADLRRFTFNAIAASFLPSEEKLKLHARCDSESDSLVQSLGLV